MASFDSSRLVSKQEMILSHKITYFYYLLLNVQIKKLYLSWEKRELGNSSKNIFNTVATQCGSFHSSSFMFTWLPSEKKYSAQMISSKLEGATCMRAKKNVIQYIRIINGYSHPSAVGVVCFIFQRGRETRGRENVWQHVLYVGKSKRTVSCCNGEKEE